MKMVRMILYAVMIDSGFYLTVSAQEIFVTWNLQTDVIRFGEDMVLVCNVHGVTRIDNGLIRQWSRDNDLITFNGKCKDPNKYEEIVSSNNQISLKINNVTEEDLNCNYQCRYSFHVYTKRLDIGPNIFEYPPSPETTVLNYTNITGRPAISLSIKKIYPLPNCSIMLMGKKSDFQVVNDSQTGLFYKVYLVHPEEDILGCRKDLTVYCQLIRGYSLNLPLPDMSDANMCKDNLTSLIIGLNIFMLILILLLCLYLKRRRTSDRKDTTVYYTNVKSKKFDKMAQMVYLLFVLMIYPVTASISWKHEPNVIQIGKSVNLTCTVKGLTSIDAGLIRHWSRGNYLICYNGHVINSSKYTEILTTGNQFKLQIKNLTESDLKYKYQCRYNFDTYTADLEPSNETFIYPPTTDTISIGFSNTSRESMMINLHLKKVYPRPTCAAKVKSNINMVKEFAVQRIERKDPLYYEVDLILEFDISAKCGEDIEVFCDLMKEQFIIATKKIAACTDQKTNSVLSNFIITLICVCSCITVIFATLVLICFKRQKRKQKGHPLPTTDQFRS